MIHVRHTPAAELARQRIRRAIRCVPLVLLPGLAVASWSSSIRLVIPQGQSGCNFHGVVFIPPEADAQPTPAPALTPHLTAQEIPLPAITATTQPEFALPELPLAMLEQNDDVATEIKSEAKRS